MKIPSLAAPSLLSCVCLLAFLGSGCCHTHNASKQVAWEYKQLEGLPSDKQLNEYGKQGFVVDRVLMGTEGSNNSIRYYMLLKRPVK